MNLSLFLELNSNYTYENGIFNVSLNISKKATKVTKTKAKRSSVVAINFLKLAKFINIV